HGEILGEDEDQPAFYASVTSNEAVTISLLLRHAEIGAAMRDHLVEFLECTFVEEEFDPLTGRHLAFFVLARAALFAATRVGQRIAAFQLCKFLFQVHLRKNYSCPGAAYP